MSRRKIDGTRENDFSHISFFAIWFQIRRRKNLIGQSKWMIKGPAAHSSGHMARPCSGWSEHSSVLHGWAWSGHSSVFGGWATLPTHKHQRSKPLAIKTPGIQPRTSPRQNLEYIGRHGFSLSGSYQQGYSTTYNTQSHIKVVCNGYILTHISN